MTVSPGLLVTHGARATEAVLFELLEGALPVSGGGLRRAASLARPVRVVVHSTSLRLHLSAELVRRRGAVAGLQVQTLHGVAREVLERSGQRARLAGLERDLPGDLPFEVLVRREARKEATLARGLDFLVDGYGAVAATVRDLLDAGLELVLADAIDEALTGTFDEDSPFRASRAEVERARALVRVATRVEEELQRLGTRRHTALFADAADRLARDPERCLPASQVLIHGFADATGLASDLLAALVRHRDARLLLDAPPDPASTLAAGHATCSAADPLPPRWQEAFSERLRERLAGSVGEMEAAPAGGPPPPPHLELFVAPGGEAEAREVALRVRALLDGTTGETGPIPPPESIGIVARDLEAARLALRGQLSTLGVPFSGLGARGSLTAAGRRTRALLDLLRKGRDLPADRWLDASATLPRDDPGGSRRRRGPFVDLRLAFYATGTGTLRDAADLDLDALLAGRDGLPLPVRKGFSYEDDDRAGDEAGGASAEETAQAAGRPGPRSGPRTGGFARRRYVPRAILEGGVRTAQSLLDRLLAWPVSALPSEHLAHLRALLTQDLGWRLDDATSRPVIDALALLERDLPASLTLTYDEFRMLLHRSLEDAGRTPLGGAGGGVQVLSVVEARGRTFSHLFVVGAHRGSFPGSVRTDPLLPDPLRRALADVLPDVPRKIARFDEERYLFAQLLSSSLHVTVSWQSQDDDGQPLAPSPLVERLLGHPSQAGGKDETDGQGLTVQQAPAVYSTATGPLLERGPRPAREVAVVAGLDGASRVDFGGLFAIACEESRRALHPSAVPAAGLSAIASATPAQHLASARLRVLDEMAPDLRSEEGRARAASLGPYLGFLGPVASTASADAGDDPAPGTPRRDPRLAAPWVTHVENLAACPWQTFLRKVLRLEPTPDPLQALPGADPLLLGSVVHSVLERLAEASGAPIRSPLAQALAGTPVILAWPRSEDLEAWLLEAAEEALRRDGVPLPGLARALADRARPLVDRARELEAGDPPGGAALGAEVAGEVTVVDGSGAPRALRFLADRVDRSETGDATLLQLTDYKTGRPISDRKQAKTRYRKHLDEVRSGLRLQAVAYRLAALALAEAAGEKTGAAIPSPTVVGRYLFLKPEIEEREMAVFASDGLDAELTAAFHDAVGALLAAWDAGAFFPRVVDPVEEKEPKRCEYCEVSEACVRGDSGARQRLLRWNRQHAGTAKTPAEAAHNRVWWLAASPEQRQEAAATEAETPPSMAATGDEVTP